jgi:ubiquinone/menaquinone biosynthesis C-methylase UbiE
MQRMNRLESWFCASSLWRYITQRRLLPWILTGTDLGENILELGAGWGAATAELQRRAHCVTSLEFDHKAAAILQSKISVTCSPGLVVQGDASTLPFADQIFTGAIAILMLHHLRSRELQDQAFAEIYRVLKPGGIFLTLEIQDGWLQRAGHIYSTFVPVSLITAPERLQDVGFSNVIIDTRGSAFRLRATRAKT